MTLQLVPGTPLYEDMRAGRFQPQTAQGILEETRLLLQNIKYGPIHFTSDHASNYLALKGHHPGGGAPDDRRHRQRPGGRYRHPA